MGPTNIYSLCLHSVYKTALIMCNYKAIENSYKTAKRLTLDSPYQYICTLNSFSQVIPSSLFVNDRLVDLSGSEVIIFGESDVQEAFIVPQV